MDVKDLHVRLVDQVICHRDVVSVIWAILEHQVVTVVQTLLTLALMEHVYVSITVVLYKCYR